MEAPPLELLQLSENPTGPRYLLLSKRVSWTLFPEYAEAIVRYLEGSIVERATSPVDIVWSVRLQGLDFWICFNDDPYEIVLDPKDERAAEVLPSIRADLLAWRERPPVA